MHNNYYFLTQLVPALENSIKGAILTNCFSQNKDELILEFQLKNNAHFFIKAYQKSDFSCLSFPTNYHRAKKNSIDLFREAIGQKVIGLLMFTNERAFTINFKNHKLLFKLFGNQSNIILFKDDAIIELFKNNLKRDKSINLNNLNRKLDISFENLESNNWNIRKVIPTLDKQSAEELLQQFTRTKKEGKRKVFEMFISELNSPTYYLKELPKGYKLSLINTAHGPVIYDNPILAITAFFKKEVKLKALNAAKSNILAELNGQLKKSKNYTIKVAQKLAELSNGSSNQQIADVLMANLHAINKGHKTAELYNFYTDSVIIIKLNPLQTLQKNAERYYRKSKNETKEIAILKNNIKKKKSFIISLEEQINEVEQSDDIKTLLKWKPKQNASSSNIILPYKEFSIDGFKILVGKNAKHNDTLTLKIAKKDDLWLHAKDVSGSHVVIKQIPGKNYPAYIIEKAAQLAAYYSKRKTDSLCPVSYTPKKYVRKKKGAPAGAVLVEKERVLLVHPSNKV